MSFLNLAAFGFLSLVPVIIFFYLLKLRRRPHVVPSTLFWQRAVEDLTANAPYQKLKRNLLLYLQLLVLALLTMALARPMMNLEARDGRSFVLLLDTSASMLTREGSTTRFDEARRMVEELMDGMKSGDSMMVMSFARQPRIVSTFTGDRAKLRQALGGLSPTHEGTSLTEALLLAHSLGRRREAPEIVIVSDGAVAKESLPSELDESIPIRFLKVGMLTANVGFTRVDLRRAPENDRDFQVFAEVSNSGAAPVSVPLEVRNNGNLVDVRTVRVEARATASLLLESTMLQEGDIMLSLTTVDDPFPVDDVAYLTLRKPQDTRVLLVTPGNYFLEKAIRFDRELHAEVTLGVPGQWPPAEGKTYDVVVFDTTMPDEPLPPGNYLVIGAVPKIEGFALNGDLSFPPIYDWDGQHPVMKFVELADVAIAKALDITLPPASAVLASTLGGKPLVALYSAENRNVILLTFDLFDSNLPLRMAFPLFMSNALHFLGRGKAASQGALHTTGDVVELQAPQEVESVTITKPDGKRVSLGRGPLGVIAFNETQFAGFYGVDGLDGGTKQFGVNLLDRAESDITPRTTLEIGSERTTVATRLNKVNTEIWPWFALVGLLLLFGEWVIFHRRIGV